MRIIELNVSNVLRLKAVSIRPDGSLVQITGRNDQGKSSVLNAIWLALKQVMVDAPNPLREGCERGHIKLSIGDGEHVALIVERTYTASGTTALTVEDPNTRSRFKSPQTMLDALIGDLCFDPLEFARMKPQEQLDRLRALVHLDVDVDDLDRQNAADFEERTVINREERTLRAQAIIPSGPDDRVNVDLLLKELSDAEEHNKEVSLRQRVRDTSKKDLDLTRDRADELAAEAEAMRNEASRIDAKVNRMRTEISEREMAIKTWQKLPDLIDTAPIKRKISEAGAINDAVARRELARAQGAIADTKRQQSLELTQRINEREQRKQAAIAAAKMPIDGLGFGDGCVTLHGLPFSQASSMQKIETSMAIALSANPKLKVVCIRDGSLLDEESLARISTMAETAEAEVWIERVDTSGKIGFVIEDGEVKR